jgi:serine/threonine protein phosphatase PrpC
MRIIASGQTDVGRQRDHNEDACLLDPDLGLYIVCDGMGGHAAGEIASQETVRLVQASIRRQRAVLSDYINAPTFDQRTQVLHLVEEAVQEACAHVYAMGQSDPLKQGKVHVHVEALGLKIGEAVGDSACRRLARSTLFVTIRRTNSPKTTAWSGICSRAADSPGRGCTLALQQRYHPQCGHQTNGPGGDIIC